MAQGQKLTDRQIETIRLVYAETASQREAARRAKCAVSAVKKYIAPVMDGLEQLRTQKKADIIEEIASVRLVLLTAMKSDEKVAKASMAELATSFGILVDKHQLLIGEATERHEHRDVDEARESVARRLDELALRRRAKAADLVADGAASG